MTRDLLIITALACEAAPLITAWKLKPLRQGALAERFQVFQRDGISVAVSGVGKIKSAIATAALLGGLFAPRSLAPLVVNIGIAGTSVTDLPIGALTYINKVRDVATNSRHYPDVLLAHSLPEYALDTYDAPVTTPPKEPIVVDMEGAGFAQAALALVPPSQVCILKVISDYCAGTEVTREQVHSAIASQMEPIYVLLNALRTHLPDPPRMTEEERALLDAVYSHAAFSLTQRTEITRRVQSLKARNISCDEQLKAILATPITSKETRNRHYHGLLRNLQYEVKL